MSFNKNEYKLDADDIVEFEFNQTEEFYYNMYNI